MKACHMQALWSHIALNPYYISLYIYRSHWQGLQPYEDEAIPLRIPAGCLVSEAYTSLSWTHPCPIWGSSIPLPTASSGRCPRLCPCLGRG